MPGALDAPKIESSTDARSPHTRAVCGRPRTPEDEDLQARQPAQASRYCCQAAGRTGAATRMKMVGPGAFGLRRGCMPVSTGVRFPLRRLQGAQEVTMLSQSLCPPRLLGITWSTVRCEVVPQYW